MTNSFLSDTFTALADPTRRVVFEAGFLAPAAVGDLAKELPVSRPAVSQHLKVLSDAGLVTARAEGTRRVYSIRREGLEELRTWARKPGAKALTKVVKEIESEKEEPFLASLVRSVIGDGNRVLGPKSSLHALLCLHELVHV